MWMIFQFSTLLTILHIVIALTLSIRVIMRRPATGVALAWVLLVSAVPFVGAIVYLLVGERRVGLRRAKRLAELRVDYSKLVEMIEQRATAVVDWDRHQPVARGMDRLGRALVGFPTVAGCGGTLYCDAHEILEAIATDIRAAEKSVLMEFYIWNSGGLADDVLEALIQAAQRGVSCRLLVDALGGRPWWNGDQPQQLRDAGVAVEAALPVGIFQTFVGRNDLRLHRKIVVVDGRVAWTGSMNLVDPRYFKVDANVGQWIDCMLRAEGSVVMPLAMTMIGDWLLETGESLEEIIRSAKLTYVAPKGEGDMQVIPSGPGETDDAILQMMLSTISAAQEELVLTTPYFVPDDSMLRALRGAAGRGVQVDLILPAKVDSLMTRFAARSYYDELMDAGVRIHLYEDGLLHTKSITSDRHVSMFGTANLDMRSLWLNYEVCLFVYGDDFGQALYAIQNSYIAACEQLDPKEWAKRSIVERFLENLFRLFSPIL